jgi:mannose-6-phosphate isomerase-like protein (cupin superfamily)
MSYPPEIWPHDVGEASAWVRRAGATPDVVYRQSGNTVRYLARGAETGGTYGLYDWEFGGPVTGPDPHFHKTLTESFYILEGTVTIFDGRAWAKCHTGDFVHVPAGGLHGFRNEDGPARMLLHFAPGAPREPYFEGLARGIGDLTPDERDAFMREHDNHWLE